MDYVVERVPLPSAVRTTRGNPIAAQMRRLDVGESFVVPGDDPNWRASLISNENQRGGGHFLAVPVAGGRRIYRDS